MQHTKSEGNTSLDIIDFIILLVGIAAGVICYNFPF